MNTNYIRKVVMLATASGLVAAGTVPAQAAEAADRQASTLGNAAQSAPSAVVNVPADVTVNVARTPYTTGTTGITATAAPTASSYATAGSPEEVARMAASAGMQTWWYTDANGNYHSGTVGAGAYTAAATQAAPTAYYASNTQGAANTAAPVANTTATAAPAVNTTNVATPAAAVVDTKPNATVGGSNATILNIAAAYLGRPYAYVGNSPVTGWSCVGYTQFVFNQAGYNMPHAWPHEQAAWILANGGRIVSDPQPGDFIYQANGGGGVAHTGIYAGNGMMHSAANPSQGTITHPTTWGSGTVYYRMG